MAIKDAVGRYGEDAASRWLQSQGWEVLDRNWRCARGELDIVARDGPDGVFVEVKTRRTGAFGPAVEAVDAKKLARLRLLAGQWLSDHPGARFDQIRIDVIGVYVPRSGGPEFDHVRACG